jgi:serine phosphatase RsbU (regulator of sigma subunit)
LGTALERLGLRMRAVRAGETQVPANPGAELDVVLISASLGLQRVALLSQRFAAIRPRPVVLVFPEDDLAVLEACARAGFDYVTAPFLPGLLRSRLLSAQERGNLTEAVEMMAVEAALRAHERDLSSAQEIQAGLLPAILPTPPGWELAVRFRPARQVAGDFYDCFELVNGLRLGFLVADVCDKGLSAALFMALMRTLLRHTAEQAGAWAFGPPAAGAIGGRAGAAGGTAAGGLVTPTLSIGAGPLLQAITNTNRYLARNHLGQGYFVTLFFGVLDPVSGGLLFVNAGHSPAVLLRAAGTYQLLPPTGPALGIVANGVFTVGTARLGPGDSLVSYTDGVLEARSPDGAQFGMSPLLDVLVGATGSAESLLTAVDERLAGHVRTAPQHDDITMLALHRTAAPGTTR